MNKKLIALLGVLTLTAALLSGCGGESDVRELNVYNWGEYISDGSDGSLDTVRAFEDWYFETYGEEVRVNYDTFSTNEDMYNKISRGAVSYDVIIPSDYMIARMAEEDLLVPLNFENIPNYQYVDESFRGLYYDPDDAYSIPYAYGVVGIIYDANVVDEEDLGNWDVLWNEKYADTILQFNNSRDAFGTAMYKLGIDVNTTDPAQWDRAAQELLAQRPLVKSYVMDEIFNMMEAGEASVAAYYGGDYFIMQENQADHVDLQLYYPEKTNYFVDAMCIPTCVQNQELAEIFINYMLSEEAAIANAEYTWYPVPNQLVYENQEYIDYIGEDAMEMLYPDLGDFSQQYNQYAFRNLSPEMLDNLNSLWETIKIN